MFFAVDLLCPQHGGKFSIAWICATRGVHSYRRKLILDCNIVKLCQDILEMIVSGSNRPKLRLSLSLSSRLICGAAKIYREQVKALEADIIHFIISIRRPKFVQELDNSSEPMPIAKVLKKRKKRNVTTNDASMIMPPPGFVDDDLQTIVANLEVELANGNVIVNEDGITLREEAPRRSDIELDNFRGEGDFGVIEDVNPPLYPDFAPKDTTLLQQVEQQDIVRKTPTKRKSTRSTKKTDVEQITIQPEPIPDIEIPVANQEIERIEHIEQPLLPVVIVETPSLPKKLPKKKQVTLAKTRIKIKLQRSINIDRTDLFNIWTYRNVVPIACVKPKLDDIVVLPLLACFMDNDLGVEKFLSSVHASPRASFLNSYGHSHAENMQTRMIHTTPIPSIAESSGRHEIVVPVDVHPVPRKRKRTAEASVPAETLNINEIEVEQPPQELALCTNGIEQQSFITVAPPDVTVIVELPPAAGASKAQSNGKFISQASLKADERRKRLKLIKHLVKDWDTAKQGEMTIEDFCAKPINRFNIAVAFNDLLIMHKMGYVKLLNKHNSWELGSIEKGPNIIKNK
ncbi:hypothetical protein RN001_006471 [Aquatica leii]|uniref:Rad21/Rec8-like protein N-terminal domain-containing protein n=1 Tax=Aquatica leii TaxID=1421715 RepID=A0AAN7PDK2_9COLE|nr:hypothetical protein RN001_006471 [Aquatica leii]